MISAPSILRGIGQGIATASGAAPADARPWLVVAGGLLDGAAAVLEGRTNEERERAAMDAAEVLARNVERAKFR